MADDEESRSAVGNIQSEIPRFARNDSLNQVFTQPPYPLLNWAGELKYPGGSRSLASFATFGMTFLLGYAAPERKSPGGVQKTRTPAQPRGPQSRLLPNSMLQGLSALDLCSAVGEVLLKYCLWEGCSRQE